MNLRQTLQIGLLALTLTWAGFGSVRAQGTLHPLFTNGPTSKRINVVVLAEGFTTNQESLFLIYATNAIASLLAQQPYLEYKDYFNAYAVFVPSHEAGSDHPISGVFKSTYFNSSFDSFGIARLLAIPPNNGYDNNYASGQGKVDTLLASLMPEYDLVIMLVNDFEDGGSGGSTLISSINDASYEIVIHESGHTFAGLADEYTTLFPGWTPTEKPNSTAITSSNSIKWRAWIPPGTLIPTPDHPTNAARVGLFQGSQYQSSGWYRPKMDCKMRNLGVDFCEVCSEQLVKSIYTRIRPIDSFAPATTNLTIYSTQAVTFSVSPLQPLDHTLSIQWFTNNVAVSAETNFSYQLAPKLLGNGSRTVRAVVSDPTPLVRTDAGGLLRQTNSWNLTISLHDLALISAQHLATNRFRFTVTGAAPSGFVIQTSTNLLNWTRLATNTLTGGKFDFTNSNLTNAAPRFYRTIAPP